VTVGSFQLLEITINDYNNASNIEQRSISARWAQRLSGRQDLDGGPMLPEPAEVTKMREQVLRIEVIVGRSLSGEVGPLCVPDPPRHVPRDWAIAKKIFEDSMPGPLGDLERQEYANREKAVQWAQDIQQQLPSWIERYRHTVDHHDSDEHNYIGHSIYCNHPASPPSGVPVVAPAAYVLLSGCNEQSQMRPVLLSNSTFVPHALNFSKHDMDYRDDSLFAQQAESGPMYACAIPTNGGAPFHHDITDAWGIAWCEPSGKFDFISCGVYGLFEQYRACEALTKSMTKAWDSACDTARAWLSLRGQHRDEYPDDMVFRGEILLARLTVHGVPLVHLRLAFEEWQYVLRHLRGWCIWQLLLDNRLSVTSGVSRDASQHVGSGSARVDSLSPDQANLHLRGVWLESWSRFQLFSCLGVPAFLITLVPRDWTPNCPTARLIYICPRPRASGSLTGRAISAVAHRNGDEIVASFLSSAKGKLPEVVFYKCSSCYRAYSSNG